MLLLPSVRRGGGTTEEGLRCGLGCLVGGGVGGGGEGDGARQHGPVQLGCLRRSLRLLSRLHLRCNQLVQEVHCTDLSFLSFSLILQTEQNQGPGFCSIPAI